tara:strand:+ start:48 stop:1655 length:1608 start_codon:yes stop_codon:yes gene_type:complete
MIKKINFFRRPYQVICLNKNDIETFFIRTKDLDKKFFLVKFFGKKNLVKKINTPFDKSYFIKYKNGKFLEVDKKGRKIFVRNFFGNIIEQISLNKKNMKIECCFYDNETHKLILIESKYNKILLYDFNLNKSKSINFKKEIVLKDVCIEKFEKNFLLSYNKNRLLLLDKNFRIFKNLDKKLKLRHIKSIKYNNNIFAICDYLSHQVKFFNHKLKYIESFGGKGSSQNKLDLPNHLDVHKNKLIISDLNNDRILKIVTKEKANTLIKSEYINGDFRRPIKILKKNNYLYVLDRDNCKLSILNKKLRFVCNIKIKTFNNAKPNSFTFGEFKKKECIAILYRFFDYRNKILIYNFSGKLVSTKIIKTKDAQDINYLKKKFIVADTLNRRLNLYNDKFNLIKSKRITLLTKNKKALVKFVEIDQNNFIYTSDFDNCIILKFDENLNFIDKFNFNGFKREISVIRYAYLLHNKLFIFSRNKYPIWVYNFENKKFISKIGKYKLSNKKFFLKNPTSLVFDKRKMYIVDKENDKVIYYNRNF